MAVRLILDRTSSKTPQRLVVAIAVTCWGYTALRAAVLSISHDEALTYASHVRGTLSQVFMHTNTIPSNNHLLNTIMIKCLPKVLGRSEWVLRTPALMGHALYLAACASLLALFLSGHRLVIGFALMATNPFLLDFFSCARGYSLALGFSTLGLYAAAGTTQAVKAFIAVALVASLIAGGVALLGRPRRMVDSLLLSEVAILLLIALALKIEFVLFSMRYAIGRGGLYLVPLFLLLFLLLWAHGCSASSVRTRRTIDVLCACASAALLVHALLCANLTHYYR